MSGDHMILNTITGKFNCLNCGKVEKYNELLPLPLDTAIAVMNSYNKQHRRCKKSTAGEELQKKNEEIFAEFDRKKAKEET